jgi:hypothetical protein
MELTKVQQRAIDRTRIHDAILQVHQEATRGSWTAKHVRVRLRQTSREVFVRTHFASTYFVRVWALEVRKVFGPTVTVPDARQLALF